MLEKTHGNEELRLTPECFLGNRGELRELEGRVVDALIVIALRTVAAGVGSPRTRQPHSPLGAGRAGEQPVAVPLLRRFRAREYWARGRLSVLACPTQRFELFRACT